VYWFDSIDASYYEDAETVESLRDVYSDMLLRLFPGALEIIRIESHEGSSSLFGPDYPARQWVLFKVNRPIPRWPVGTKWGLPSIAPNGEQTLEGDTIQSPEPEPLFDDWIPDTPLGKALLVGGAIGLATLVVIAIKS
jgi:hypothetical protein